MDEINRLMVDADNEMKSFNGGRAAAATRARKSLLLIKKQSDQLRKSILEQQKAKKQPQADVAEEKEDKKKQPKQAAHCARPMLIERIHTLEHEHTEKNCLDILESYECNFKTSKS